MVRFNIALFVLLATSIGAVRVTRKGGSLDDNDKAKDPVDDKACLHALGSLPSYDKEHFWGTDHAMVYKVFPNPGSSGFTMYATLNLMVKDDTTNLLEFKHKDAEDIRDSVSSLYKEMTFDEILKISRDASVADRATRGDASVADRDTSRLVDILEEAMMLMEVTEDDRNRPILHFIDEFGGQNKDSECEFTEQKKKNILNRSLNVKSAFRFNIVDYGVPQVEEMESCLDSAEICQHMALQKMAGTLLKAQEVVDTKSVNEGSPKFKLLRQYGLVSRKIEEHGKQECREELDRRVAVVLWWDALCNAAAAASTKYLRWGIATARSYPALLGTLPREIANVFNDVKTNMAANVGSGLTSLVLGVQEAPIPESNDETFINSFGEKVANGIRGGNAVLAFKGQQTEKQATAAGIIIINADANGPVWGEGTEPSIKERTPATPEWFNTSVDKSFVRDFQVGGQPVRLASVHGKKPVSVDTNGTKKVEDNLVVPLLMEYLKPHPGSLVVMTDTNSEKFKTFAKGFPTDTSTIFPRTERLTTLKHRTVLQAQQNKVSSVPGTKDFIISDGMVGGRDEGIFPCLIEAQ